MKFLSGIHQRKIEKAVIASLLVGCGLVVGMGQVEAADYISADAKKIDIKQGYAMWIAGKNEITVKSAASQPAGFKAFDGNMVLGGFSETGKLENKKVEIVGATVNEDVYGGMSMSGQSSSNTVSINNASLGGDVYGGMSEDGVVQKNTLILTNTVVEQDVYGGFSDNRAAKENVVNITGGTIRQNIYGGYSEVNASSNTLTIKGTKLNFTVYGGYSECGNASSNTVNFTDGTFVNGLGFIYGGITKNEADSGKNGKTDANTIIVNLTGDNTSIHSVYGAQGIISAQNNKVLITCSKAGTISSIIGGDITQKGTANSNLVVLKGATADSVTGGNTYKEGSSANNNLVVLAGAKVGINVIGGRASTEKDNSVVLVGRNGIYNLSSPDGNYKEVVKSIKGNVIGSAIHGGKDTGNTLKVYGIENQAGNLEDFQKLEFVLPKGDSKGRDLLTIANTANEVTRLNNIESIVVTAAEGALLNKGNKVNLIHKKDNGALELLDTTGKAIFNATTGKAVNPSAIVVSSPLKATSGEVTLEKLEGTVRNDLVFTAKENISVNINPELAYNVKSTVETRANGAALLNEGADFLTDYGMTNAKLAAKESNRELTPFAVVGGGKMRYNTGSHIDSRSWHGALGVSKQVGSLVYGLAAEQGRSNYDSYVDAAHGQGKSKATGGAVFAELKKAKGVYYDAAVRGGRISNDYSANLSLFSDNQHLSYKESSTYYGLSLGLGKEINLNEKNQVNFYGRYYWNHTNSSTALTNRGDTLAFEAINSHRLKLGSRLTHKVNSLSKVYAGVAWQYEFSGKADAVVNGDKAPAPSLKGHSGMLELGWKVEAGRHLTIDLNANGWAGKQRGVAGGVELQWQF